MWWGAQGTRPPHGHQRALGNPKAWYEALMGPHKAQLEWERAPPGKSSHTRAKRSGVASAIMRKGIIFMPIFAALLCVAFIWWVHAKELLGFNGSLEGRREGDRLPIETKLTTSRRPPRRRIGGVGKEEILADWLWNSSSGSFWLPPPPPRDKLIGGYEVRRANASSLMFHPEEYNKPMYGGKVGFMLEHQVNIFMSETYNAGDFLACFIAPMISGRRAALRTADEGNRMSLSVVGSILHWGIRYAWGPGFMTNKDRANSNTEVVFAARGPKTYDNFTKSISDGTRIDRVFGDAGSLISWYYQPHNQTKVYPLCLLPHGVDRATPFILRAADWWNDTYLVIDILAPLFDIIDDLVQCEFVLSSSLHGIIFSDSYQIPNAHMKYEGHVTGGHYKFDDYFSSVGRVREWFDMANESRWDEVAEFVSKQRRQYDSSGIQLLPFWHNCPMHAEAYNRTREEHLQFTRTFVKAFATLLSDRPKEFDNFHNKLQLALQKRKVVLVNGEKLLLH